MAKNNIEEQQTNSELTKKCCNNPCNHKNCIIAILRGARNGFFYGARLRFAHAFVMSFLFGKGTYKERIILAVKMALKHG